MQIIDSTTTLNTPPPESVAVTTVEMSVPAGQKLIAAGWAKVSPGTGGAVFLAGSYPVDVETWRWVFEYQAPSAVDVDTFLVVEDV